MKTNEELARIAIELNNVEKKIDPIECKHIDISNCRLHTEYNLGMIYCTECKLISEGRCSDFTPKNKGK